MSAVTASTRSEALRAVEASAAAALEALAAAAGAALDAPTAIAALRESAHIYSAEDLDSCRRMLATAAGLVGLRLHQVELSPEELAAEAARAIPLAVCSADENGRPVWRLIARLGRGRALVQRGVGDAGEWMNLAELASLLGLASTDQRTGWFTAEPALPFGRPAAQRDSAAVHAEHEHPTPFRRLLTLIRSERHDIAVVLVFAVAVGVLALATPLAVEALVTTVAFGGLIQPLVVLALMLLLFLALGAFLRGVQTYVIEVLQRRVFVRLVADLAYRLPRARREALDSHHGPELMNRFFDVLTVQKTGALLLLDGLAIVLQTLIGMVVLAFYHPALLAFDILLLTAILIVVFGLGRGAVRTSIAESRAKYAVAGWLEDIARHDTVFHTNMGADYALQRADALATSYVRHRREHFRIVMRQIAAALALQVVASAGLLGLGGWLVMEGQLTLGQLVAAELIVTVIVGSFAKLGKHLEAFYDLLTGLEKLGHLTDLPVEQDTGAAHPGSGPVAIRLHHVAYGFGGHAVLADVDLAVAPGERLALLGPAGSGKSVLLDILHGMRHPHAGHVEFDGLDLRELRLESVRERICLLRGVEIFAGSIADNVHLDRPGVGPLEVRGAMEAVGLLDELLDLPAGLQTELQTGGRPLSESQARRLILARAIAARPRLLLLDRALDGLSAEDRRACIPALLGKQAAWTAVVVSDDPEVIAHCTRRHDLVATLTSAVSLPSARHE
jgi:putative ABC transport system ATP-binding protein